MSWLFIFIALLLNSCIGSLAAVDQTCGNKVVSTIVVEQTGSGKFRTVQAAIDSVGERNPLWIQIKVKRGLYVEKVTIPSTKPCIIVEGEGQRVTTITYNAHEATDVSSTFTSNPSHIVVRNITIMNTYNHLSIRTTPNANAMSWQIKPAVAVSVYGDKSAFYNCGFLGLQDTLWDNQGMHYFKNCYIEGAVDFIFGNGQSIYEDCHINATAGALASKVSFGFITAQARSSVSDTSGFVFLRGSVSGNTNVYLGRAYRPFSRVIFIQTDLASVVLPKGWSPWNYTGHEWSFTYAEVECKGAGSDMTRRVPWINKLNSFYTKQRFSISNFIDQDRWISNIPRF